MKQLTVVELRGVVRDISNINTICGGHLPEDYTVDGVNILTWKNAQVPTQSIMLPTFLSTVRYAPPPNLFGENLKNSISIQPVGLISNAHTPWRKG